MAAKAKTAKMSRKVGKKAVSASVPEKKVENKAEIEILPTVDRKLKFRAELDGRVEKLKKFAAELNSDSATLADYEYLLGMAYDCRNSARKLEKVNSPVILA